MRGALPKQLLALLFLLLPVAAGAQVAFTTQAVNMRAGPDRAFPQVTWLHGGVSVRVAGCINGWRWCDVIAGRNRGWVYGRYLSFNFHGQRMPFITGGPQSGVPIVTFSIGPYWSANYRGRPWYANQSQWNNWRPPAGPPRRPRPPPARPRSQRPPTRPPSGNRPPSSPRQSGGPGTQ